MDLQLFLLELRFGLILVVFEHVANTICQLVLVQLPLVPSPVFLVQVKYLFLCADNNFVLFVFLQIITDFLKLAL